MSRSLKSELRHQKILLKYSYRNAKQSSTDELKDLFISQCFRIEQKIKELKKLMSSGNKSQSKLRK